MKRLHAAYTHTDKRAAPPRNDHNRPEKSKPGYGCVCLSNRTTSIPNQPKLDSLGNMRTLVTITEKSCFNDTRIRNLNWLSGLTPPQLVGLDCAIEKYDSLHPHATSHFWKEKKSKQNTHTHTKYSRSTWPFRLKSLQRYISSACYQNEEEKISLLNKL